MAGVGLDAYEAARAAGGGDYYGAGTNAGLGLLDAAAVAAPTPATVGMALAGHGANYAINDTSGGHVVVDSLTAHNPFSSYDAPTVNDAMFHDMMNTASRITTQHRLSGHPLTAEQMHAIWDPVYKAAGMNAAYMNARDAYLNNTNPRAPSVGGGSGSGGGEATTTPAATPAAAPAAKPSLPTVPVLQGQLPPGVARSSVYGVYEGVTRDGRRVFSDNPDELAAGSYHPAVHFAGTQVDPRYVRTDAGGWTDQPGVAAFDAPAYDDRLNTQAMQRRIQSEPVAGLGYAAPTGAEDVNNDIRNTTSPMDAYRLRQEFSARVANDPNADNPTVRAANAYAMQRLSGNIADSRQREIDQLSGSGGGGGGGGGGNLATTLVNSGAYGGGITGPGGTPIAGGTPLAQFKTFSDAAVAMQNAHTNAERAQAQEALNHAQFGEKELQDVQNSFDVQHNPQLQVFMQRTGLDQRTLAQLALLQQHHISLWSNNPTVTALRERFQQMLASGLAQSRGPLDKFGNWLGINNRAPITAGERFPVRITQSGLGDPVLTVAHPADATSYNTDYANLAGRGMIRHITGLGYGDASPLLTSMYNDNPYTKQAILDLANPPTPAQ